MTKRELEEEVTRLRGQVEQLLIALTNAHQPWQPPLNVPHIGAPLPYQPFIYC